MLKRTDQEATGSEVVWAKELGYELDDDRIHQLLTPAGRLAIQSRAIRLEHGVRERNAGADGARSAVVQAQKDAETARGAVDRADSDLDRAQKRLSVEEAQGLVARVRGRHDIADVRLDVAKKSEDSDFAADALEAAAQRLTEAEASYDGALEVTSTANRRDLAIIDSLKQRLMLDDRGHQAAAGAGRISATAGNGNQSAGGTDWSPEHIAYANELQRRSRQAVHQPVPPFEQPGVSRGM